MARSYPSTGGYRKGAPSGRYAATRRDGLALGGVIVALRARDCEAPTPGAGPGRLPPELAALMTERHVERVRGEPVLPPAPTVLDVYRQDRTSRVIADAAERILRARLRGAIRQARWALNGSAGERRDEIRGLLAALRGMGVDPYADAGLRADPYAERAE